MNQTDIFDPVFVLLLLTMIVWVYMYARRIPFIQTLDLEPNEVTADALANLSPPAVSNPSDNLKNLFELPVLFYAICGYLFVTQQVDSIYVFAAWAFTAFRILHSAVHCTVNIVLLRFGLYCVSSVALWFMIGRAALDHWVVFCAQIP